jgi:hypothetical protein
MEIIFLAFISIIQFIINTFHIVFHHSFNEMLTNYVTYEVLIKFNKSINPLKLYITLIILIFIKVYLIIINFKFSFIQALLLTFIFQ